MAYGAERVIREFVEGHPGATISDICKETELDREIVEDFIWFVIKNGYIYERGRTETGEACYFPVEENPKGWSIGGLRNDAEIIMKFLKRHPGATISEINRGTALGRNIIEDFIPIMAGHGLIYEGGRKTGTGETSYYCADSSLQKSLLESGAPLMRMARKYQDDKQYEKALELYEHVLSLAQEAEVKEIQIIILRNIGTTYYDMGNKKQMIEYYSQALSLAPDNKIKAEILLDLGLVYDELGDKEQSRSLLREALSIQSDTNLLIDTRRRENTYEFYFRENGTKSKS